MYYFIIIIVNLDQHINYSSCINGQLRLSNGTTVLQGRVEICYNNVWFGLCSHSYRYYNDYYHYYYTAATICKALGYTHGKCHALCCYANMLLFKIGPVPSYSESFLNLTDIPLFPYEFHCHEAKQSLLDCSKGINDCYSTEPQQSYYKYLGVTCQGVYMYFMHH